MVREALLGAIRANQEDRTARLVYADWLAEHNDGLLPEYIRAECELMASELGSAEWHRAIDRLFPICECAAKSLGGWEYADVAERLMQGAKGGVGPRTVWDDEVLEFEKRHGITLPGEYRAFLLRIGNGWASHGWGSSEGPAIRPLDTHGAYPQLDCAFPYTHADVVRVLANLKKMCPPGGPVDLSASSGEEYAEEGCLPLANATALVVRGELRGQVWVYGEYSHFTPWSTDDFSRPLGFFEYFEMTFGDRTV